MWSLWKSHSGYGEFPMFVSVFFVFVFVFFFISPLDDTNTILLANRCSAKELDKKSTSIREE